MQHVPDPLIYEMVGRLLDSVCDGAAIDAVESGQRAEGIWTALAENAVQLAWVPEAQGGGGGSLADVCAIAYLQGQHAAPVPLADTLLATHVLALGGISVEHGPHALSLAASGDEQPISNGKRLSVLRRRVPFAAQAEWIVVQGGDRAEPWFAVFGAGEVSIEPGKALSGEPMNDVRIDGVEPVELVNLAATWSEDALRRAGALLRAQQMAGALARILEMSVGYARDRIAFGRPIARFQAVQHNLAMLAGEAAAAAAAANAGMMAAARHGFAASETRQAVAAAKVRAGEAAGAGAAIAHQVHGAMGFTHEHRLHQFTRRLWSWRDEYGSETEWAIELGRMVAARGVADLWPGLTSA